MGKIGAREKRNNQILALVISCCLALLIYHYDFFGLGMLKRLGGDSTANPQTEDPNAAINISLPDAEHSVKS